MSLANTLNGVNLTAIAQETAKTLLPKIMGLSNFTLDLSNDIAEQGAAVVTRSVVAYTGADLSAGYTAVVANTSTVSITVTLNQFSGLVLGFTDAEMSKSSIDLDRMVYSPFANAAVKIIYDYVFALILNANFSLKTTVAAASFDSDALSDLAATMNKNFVLDAPRTFIGNSDVFNALRKDSSFKAAYAQGTNQTIVGGIIARGMGFDMQEFAWLPGNSENLIGFGAGQQGIAIAARRVADPKNWYGQVENITVADVPIQFRMWYDGNTGIHYISMGCLFGASVGVANNIVRVVSA
jgi:hypothetical protein